MRPGTSRAVRAMAALLLLAGVAFAGVAGSPEPELPVIEAAALAALRADPRLLLIDLCDEAAIAAARFDNALRPGDVDPGDIPAGCMECLSPSPGPDRTS